MGPNNLGRESFSLWASGDQNAPIHLVLCPSTPVNTMTSSNSDPHPAPLSMGEHHWIWGQKTYVMGILNTTPDSFSDGGDFSTVEAAMAHAETMVQAGVDIIDVGGQSTRPGAEVISFQEELNRVIPIVTAIKAKYGTPISVDTTRAAIAAAAIQAGADMINDISGGSFEPEILKVAAQTQVPIVLMHIRGNPQTMQTLTDYDDLVGEVRSGLEERAQLAIAAGVHPDKIILDPGIGFAKTADQNWELLQGLPQLRALGYPLLVGPSRKSFIGKLLDEPEPKKRVWGTAAACAGAIAHHGDLIRVHDVAEMVAVARVSDRIWRQSPSSVGP